MDEEFNDIEDAMFDIFIDQLHQMAGSKRKTLMTSGSVSSADRATAF